MWADLKWFRFLCFAFPNSSLHVGILGNKLTPLQSQYEIYRHKFSMGGCTVTPNFLCWNGVRGRLVRGEEALRLQGLHVPRHLTNLFSNCELMSLAGNAFHAASCSRAVITLLRLSARFARLRHHCLLALQQPLSISVSNVVGTDDDISSEDWCS